jgi:hypothetical protein
LGRTAFEQASKQSLLYMMHDCREFLRDGVKPPLCIGDVLLEDGTSEKGFLGESYATSSAPDVSQFGSWRKYLPSAS